MLMRMARAACLALVALLCALPGVDAASAQGAAQGFPVKPITLIVPWPAGGPTDLALRAIAERAGKELGQQVVVDNKSGASGTLGPAAMAATGKADGYTISQMPIPIVRLPMMQKASWDVQKDFTYIIHLTGYVFGISVRGDSPHKTWADVVKAAKDAPGKITYATPGSGTSLHIGMEQIAHHAGIKLVQVPFKGASEALTALIGGHTQLMAAGTGMQGAIDAGQVRVLAIWAEKRSKRLPQVPTLRDLGMPFVFDSPFGIAGPKGMDPAVVKRLHDAFKIALEDPAVVAKLESQEMVPRYMGPADYTRFIADLVVKERAFLETLGLLKK